MLTLGIVPTYEYECPRCPRVFEVRQRISEAALSTCERCGGPIRRLLSAAPFILKGAGWYVTDYPSESRKKALGGESGEKPSPATETKPSAGDGAGSSSSTSADAPTTGGKASPAKPSDSS